MAKGLGNIMKQAQQMQAKMARVQQELLALQIEKDVVDPEDVEMLQDLVMAAVNEAIKQSQKMIQEEMGKVTGGMNIPGLF
jgi:DNA-binding protein YbaB